MASQKVAIVTGSSGGIGYETALLAASIGMVIGLVTSTRYKVTVYLFEATLPRYSKE